MLAKMIFDQKLHWKTPNTLLSSDPCSWDQP